MSASRRIVLGVTGGIAAYKAPMIARLLRAAGHSVTIVPTPSALEMVGAPTFAAISGAEVHTSVFDDPRGVEHVDLGSHADLLLIAPATANTIAKLAHGIADNLLTATALVATCPVVVAPAMHTQMWDHPATRDNVETLRRRGVVVIEPDEGPLTGGDIGKGRLPEPAHIAQVALAQFVEQDLAGTHIVITAGGTREPLDPVRFLGNRSTGAMGIALSTAALARGAEVTLIGANLERPVPSGLTYVPVQTALELSSALDVVKADADVIVMAAAVADYRPAETAGVKVKKDGEARHIELVENPDILAGLTADDLSATIVGFAAETGDDQATFLEHGQAKARRKGADLLCVNQVGASAGFGDVDSSVTILDRAGEIVTTVSGSKSLIADHILGAISSVR